MANSTCYMCDSPETSREHAPPLCFFPEASSFGRDLRRNLITVPSCDHHNSKKSKDDEYFRSVILVVAAQSSDAARHQFFQKLLRASNRKPYAYKSFFLNQGTIEEGKGRVLRIDRNRFETCVDHLARALFFNEFLCKCSQPISVVSPKLFSKVVSDQIIPHHLTRKIVDASRQFLDLEPIRGENPDIFKYRLRYSEEDDSFAFAAIFYGCFEVYSFSSSHLA